MSDVSHCTLRRFQAKKRLPHGSHALDSVEGSFTCPGWQGVWNSADYKCTSCVAPNYCIENASGNNSVGSGTHCNLFDGCKCNDPRNCVQNVAQQTRRQYFSAGGGGGGNCPQSCPAKDGGTLSCPSFQCCVGGICVNRPDPGTCPPGKLPCRNADRTTFACCSEYCNLQTGRCDGK